jgi:Arc/MetJ-type ribon-helix-helix transcriptional regulator
MSDDELATITFRLPATLREKIKTQAAAEERSESGFIRFHIGELFRMSEEETAISPEQEGEQ